MAYTGESISSIQSLELELPPSCIEFCPSHPSYFLVGTYNLEKTETSAAEENECSKDEDGRGSEELEKSKQPQSRNGSVLAFHVLDEKVSLVQVVSQPSAILDLHFQPQSGKGDICTVISSTGTITLFQLLPEEKEILRFLSVLRIPEIGDDVLFTSFAWHPTILGLMAVTTSTYEVHLVKLADDYKAPLEYDGNPIIAHTLEAWTTAFSPDLGSPFTLYSGGDDSTLRYVFCKTGYDDDSHRSSLVQTPYCPVKYGGHEAGVTAILPLPLQTSDGSSLVLTGSYDDHIRLLAITSLDKTYGLRKANTLTGRNLDGGVWRLKLVKLVEDDQAWTATVLASCMHAGARILEIGGGAQEIYKIVILARFEEHKSMNYGSDFQPGTSQDQLLCISTSFYDRLLCVWKFGLPSKEFV